MFYNMGNWLLEIGYGKLGIENWAWEIGYVKLDMKNWVYNGTILSILEFIKV